MSLLPYLTLSGFASITAGNDINDRLVVGALGLTANVPNEFNKHQALFAPLEPWWHGALLGTA